MIGIGSPESAQEMVAMLKDAPRENDAEVSIIVSMVQLQKWFSETVTIPEIEHFAERNHIESRHNKSALLNYFEFSYPAKVDRFGKLTRSEKLMLYCLLGDGINANLQSTEALEGHGARMILGAKMVEEIARSGNLFGGEPSGFLSDVEQRVKDAEWGTIRQDNDVT